MPIDYTRPDRGSGPEPAPPPAVPEAQPPAVAQPPFASAPPLVSAPPPVVAQPPFVSAPPPGPQGRGLAVRLRGLVRLLVLGLVIGGLVLGYRFLNRDDVDNAKAGDCVSEDRGNNDTPYKLAKCGDPDARYKVFKVIKFGSGEQCRDVPGASKSFTIDGANVCIGDKDADPAKSINAAKEGDCVSVVGNLAEKLDCADSSAQYKILKRLTNVLNLGVSHACDDVPGAVSIYSWHWQSSGGIDVSKLSTDVVLCLGKK